MAKIVRLTEADLRNIIKSSVNKILREYTGDEEEFGRYDLANGLTDEDFYNIDAMNADAQGEQDDREAFEEWESNQYMAEDYWDPTDTELYRGTVW